MRSSLSSSSSSPWSFALIPSDMVRFVSNNPCSTRTRSVLNSFMITGFVRCTKRNTSVARGPYELTIGRHCLDALYRLSERHCHNVAGLQGHHYAALSIRHGAHGARTEVRRQHAIESIRTPASLHVTEDHATRLSPGHFLDVAL